MSRVLKVIIFLITCTLRIQCEDEINLFLDASNYLGDQYNDGTMFEIVALNDITIRAFDIHCDTETDEITSEIVEIYQRSASLGALRSPGAWTKITQNQVSVECQCKYMHVQM